MQDITEVMRGEVFSTGGDLRWSNRDLRSHDQIQNISSLIAIFFLDTHSVVLHLIHEGR